MPLTKCQFCLKEFYTKPSHQSRGWGKYCSINCRSKSQLKGEYFPCFICNSPVYRSPDKIAHSISKKFFCSKSCQTIWRNSEYIGEKSKNWINGKKAYRNILKRSGQPQICKVCGITDIRILNAHHINHDRDKNNIDNLVWLCINCHYLAHHDKNFEQKIKETL